MHPQQVQAFFKSGVLIKMISLRRAIGPGQLITTGIPISLAAWTPAYDMKSQIMMSGLRSLTALIASGFHSAKYNSYPESFIPAGFSNISSCSGPPVKTYLIPRGSKSFGTLTDPSLFPLETKVTSCPFS